MRVPVPLLAALIPLAIGGCFLDSGGCSYEHRTLVLDGAVTPTIAGTAAAPVAVTLMLNETRNANPDFRVLNLTYTGQLDGSFSAAELRDASTSPAPVLATWAGAPWNPNIDLVSASPSHELLAALAQAGRLQLALLFGPSGSNGILTAALGVTTDGNWEHPRCD
jgi:hypothetical protein